LIVIYHGKKSWNKKKNLYSLFEKIPGIEKYIPGFEAEVFDISDIPDNMIHGEILLRALLLTKKYIFSPELLEKTDEIFSLVESRPESLDFGLKIPR
jgi:hypothetical protein